ncbi:MAG: hypothetical protein AB1716_02185 [Planctomycetota bacterium]
MSSVRSSSVSHRGGGGRTSGARSPWVRRVWIVAGWAATAIVLAWGGQRLEPLARTPVPAYQCSFEWMNLPKSLHQDWMLDTLTRAGGLAWDDDLQDPDLCRRVGENLARTPWVAQVQRVSKQRDGLIRVHAAYREPFAFVERGDKAYLVDRSGVRLPGFLEKSASQYRLPQGDPVDDQFWNEWFRVVGAAAPPPAEGEPWPGTDLAAGLKLVDYLQQATARGEAPFRTSLREIDVANYGLRVRGFDGQLRIRFVPGNYYIHWGMPPGEEFGVEAPAARKMDMLRSAYLMNSGFPQDDQDPRLLPTPGRPFELVPGRPGTLPR